MTTEPRLADLMQRYAASSPGLGRSQLAERIVDEVLPKVRESLAESDRLLSLCEFDQPADLAGVEKVREALALIDGGATK